MVSGSPLAPAPAEGRIRTRRDGDLLFMGIDRVPKPNGFSPVMLQQLGKA